MDLRIIFLWIEGCLIAFYKWYANFPITWALGCAVTIFMACTGWKWKDRKEKSKNLTISNSFNYDIHNEINELANIFEFIFITLTPIIFGLFGLYLGTFIFNYKIDLVNVKKFTWTSLFFAFTVIYSL